MQGRGIVIYFDGLCQPVNPRGVAISAYAVLSDSAILKEGFGLAAPPYSNLATNNVAEYVGLICGLSAGLEFSKRATVIGDSRLIVKQVNGEFKVKDKKLMALHKKAIELMSQYEEVKVVWRPRNENRYTDRLTKLGYEEFLRGALMHPACELAAKLTMGR